MGSGGVPSGCGQFMRCLLVAVNFMLLVLSIGLIVVISYSIANYAQLSELAPDISLTGMLVVTLTVPVLAMIISFLGCCGAFYENKCMLILYSVIVGLLTVLFMVAFGLALAFKNETKELGGDIKEELKKSLKEYKEDERVHKVWDTTQKTFECCGVDGSADWKQAGVTRIPDSCHSQGAHIYTRGCYNVIKESISYYSPIIIGVIVALIVFMMISICAAGTLIKSINSYHEMV